MADTSSQPSLSKKLGGIPHGDRTSPGAYRKPPSFKMKPIPRPSEYKSAAKVRPVKTSKAPLIKGLLFLALLGGGGAVVYFKKAEILALLTRPQATPAPVVGGPAPEDTSPIAEASEGWLWLFPEPEWRATGRPDREFKGGLIHLRKPMEKPQAEANSAIRARIVIRDGGSSAGVVMRSSEEGRYRLFVDPDFRHVRLVRQTKDATTELAKYRFFKSLLKGDRLTLELQADGEKLFGFVNGALVIEAQDDQLAKAGNWGIEGTDAMFELVEVPVPKPKVMVAEKEPEPAPAPMPAATPMPAPAPVQSETSKWLAGMEAQWQASFDREVLGPFDQEVGDLKKQFVSTLDSQLAIATQSRKLDDAAFLRGERQRVAAGEDVPMVDEAIVPPALKQLRNGFRGNFIRVDTERFNRAKIFFAKIDATLAQTHAALTQRQRAEEAAEIKSKREQLAALWLKPAANLPPPPTVASTGTAATRAPLGSTMAPPPTLKLAPRDTVEKLLAIGAGVWVNQREVKAMTELSGDKFVISRVDFPRLKPDEKPIAAEDYALLDGLSDVNELTLRGGPAVTEALMAKLQTFRDLRHLSLEGLSGFKTPGYAVLPLLPDLQILELRGMSPSDDAMKMIGQCRKVTRLVLSNLPIGDEAFVSVAKMSALTELSLNNLDKITSPAIVHLVECKGLRRLTMGGFTVTSPMIEAVGRCTALESLTLSGNALKDDQILGLGGLSRLQTLSLSGTEVVGTAFTKWPTRTSLINLNLGGAPGVNDEALKGIASAFPRLEVLEFKVVPLGAGLPGYSAIGRLRNLRTLRISGEGVNDEAAAEIGKSNDLQYLSIDGARLTEPGAAALAKLNKLTDLRIDHPPVTDAALKSFGKLKILKSLTIATDAPPETETKLRAALTGVAIRRGG